MNNKNSKLEGFFLKSFFKSFLISIFLSTSVLTIFVVIFTNTYYDKRSIKDIINLEKKNSKLNINSANNLVTTYVNNLQLGLNELIVFYQKISNDLMLDENSYTFQTVYLISAVSVDQEFCDDFFYESEYMGVWVYDKYLTNDNLDDSVKDVELQLKAISNILENLQLITDITYEYASPYFFYFEKTELYVTYPLSFECDLMFLGFLTDFYEDYRLIPCLDENGEPYSTYKLKCLSSFQNMLKSRTKIFDNNYLFNKNKSIFINNFYFDIPDYIYHDLTMCIEFDDPITKGKGYLCLEASYDDLYSSLNNLNEKIKGYFFISNIGFNHVFFFPLSTSTSKIPTDYIYNWNFSFYLNEKVNF